MEKEADLQVGDRWIGIGAGGGKELKGHCAGIIWDTVKVGAIFTRQRGQIGEAEERLERIVCAKFDCHFRAFARRCDGRVQALDNLCGQSGTRNGANWIAGVVSQVEFVVVSQRT